MKTSLNDLILNMVLRDASASKKNWLLNLGISIPALVTPKTIEMSSGTNIVKATGKVSGEPMHPDVLLWPLISAL